MPTIKNSTIDDLLIGLNDWEEYCPDGTSHLFISALGFEDRASVAFGKWSRTRSATTRQAILITYPTNVSDNEGRLEQFDTAARAANIALTKVSYKAATFYGEITTILRNTSENMAIAIDISTMASYVVYPLLKAIYDSDTNATVQVLYSEAEKYFPLFEEWEKFKEEYTREDDLIERAKLFDEQHFQSAGVDNIYESPVFPGMNLDKLPCALIMVPNFSNDRVQCMVNFASDRYAFSPSKDVIWMIGMPHDQNIDGWRHDALWEIYGKPTEKASVSTFDWKQTLQELHRIWATTQYQKALMIGTVGSKPQHLGTFVFLKMHPEVGLILSEPTEYSARRYSEGYKKVWSIKLGAVAEFNKRLSSWSRLDFYW